jgi:hypothetical protein
MGLSISCKKGIKMTTTLAQTYNDSYYTTTYYNGDYDVAAATATAIVVGLWAALIVYIVTSIFLGKLFKKAGEPAWKAWVPIYNSWTLLQLGGQNGIWAVIALIPVVNIVSAIFMYIAMYYIGKNFNKPNAFIVLGIFLPLVWIVWLAVDNSTWKGAKKSRPNN